MTMIYKEECLELGLPEPKFGERQTHYVTRVMLNGMTLDTRIARYIGIGNLHSLVSGLKKRVSFSQEQKIVRCPKTHKVPPHQVDVVWMTEEQINAYWEKKKRL